MSTSLPLSLAALVTDKVIEKAVVGKTEAMRVNNLARTLPTPIYVRNGKGTDAEKSGTKSDYENRWKHFHQFCVLLGFYTCSLVLDRDACPDRPIPVEIDTVRLYIAYMSHPKDDVLLHPDTKENIRDVMGNLVYCTAIWHSPGNLVKFCSAMVALDTLHSEITGPEYLQKCNQCSLLTLTASQNRPNEVTPCYPCVYHTDGARVRSRGCTMNDPKVKAYIAYMTIELKDYEKKGNIQLLPSEVRRIRTALLAENSIEGLQYWTMVIMGIKLFLRISELLTIKVEDFDPELMLLESTSCHVSALAVKVLGKGGKYSWLSMYCDDEFPELCPIRALLLYISLSGITKGYIFPNILPSTVTTEATQMDSSTESTEDDDESTLPAHYPYPLFMSKMKVLLTCTLARKMGPRDIFGTHILRKTAYMFAIFGMLRQYGGKVENLHDLLMSGIMQSARHACIMNVRYYSLDAATRYEWDRAKRHSTENEVPNWRSIHIMDTCVIRAATETSRTAQQHLSKIASVYLTEFLGFSVQVPIADAVERAFFLNQPTATIESSADLHVKSLLSAGDYKDYLEKKKLDLGNNPPVVPVGPSVPSVPDSTSPKRSYYVNVQRKSLASNSKFEKIRILAEMYELDHERAPVTFTASYKYLFYSKVKPVALCLAVCFDGDIAKFDQALDLLPLKGKYKCCSSTHQCQLSS